MARRQQTLSLLRGRVLSAMAKELAEMREISEILPHRHGKPPPLVKNIGPLIRTMAKKVFLSCCCFVHVHVCRECANGSVFIHVWASVRACAAHARRGKYV